MKNMYELPEIVKLLNQSGLTIEQQIQAINALLVARIFGMDEAASVLKSYPFRDCTE
jgi:hypothetical protein